MILPLNRIGDLIPTASNVLPQYGLAGLVILALTGALVYVYKDLKGERKHNDDIQQQRLQDAKETRDKLMLPLEEQARMSDKIYELLVSGKRSR